MIDVKHYFLVWRCSIFLCVQRVEDLLDHSWTLTGNFFSRKKPIPRNSHTSNHRQSSSNLLDWCLLHVEEGKLNSQACLPYKSRKLVTFKTCKTFFDKIQIRVVCLADGSLPFLGYRLTLGFFFNLLFMSKCDSKVCKSGHCQTVAKHLI